MLTSILWLIIKHKWNLHLTQIIFQIANLFETQDAFSFLQKHCYQLARLQYSFTKNLEQKY